jgi:hypothetical protein
MPSQMEAGLSFQFGHLSLQFFALKASFTHLNKLFEAKSW